MEHKIFKPFDKVLVRNDNNRQWYCAIYSHFNKPYHYTSYPFQKNDEDIIPYEGNEHLVGTTDEPGEEVKLEEGELILAFDTYKNFFDNISCIRKFIRVLNNTFETNASTWNFAIRFSDFNPNDMEENKKHILCVKNGKITKYKE